MSLVPHECEVCEDRGCSECDANFGAERDEVDDLDFAEPGGRSALRAATSDNPRDLPCPTCGEPERLTQRDRDLGYQCDACADAAEGCGP